MGCILARDCRILLDIVGCFSSQSMDSFLVSKKARFILGEVVEMA